ncbi:hypothetical protein B0T16DRAFT_410541 [Cercophora newfieldiana]|uniref:Uncharacterized protein n=1 Tax=Cercophora newfieldiana TaxID=92897 RepID=A0AA40CT38_9PEZI|nr:hypothetical protein B0T16DRAFT_410541 [Cercophora newfieldiana]
MSQMEPSQLDAIKYQRPPEGFGKVEAGSVAIDPQYMYGMYNASATAFDLAGDLEKQLPLFIKRAQGRVMTLINIISSLRRELYDAKNDVIRANQRLHAVLLHSELNVNPDEWFKEAELKVMQSDYPFVSKGENGALIVEAQTPPSIELAPSSAGSEVVQE